LRNAPARRAAGRPAAEARARNAQVLAGNRILSAPVVAPSAGGAEAPDAGEANAAFQEVLCFLDLRDVLCSFLEELDVPAVKTMKMLRRMKARPSARNVKRPPARPPQGS